MHSKPYVVFVVLTLGLAQVTTGSATQCYECSKAVDPADCSSIITCPSGQMCGTTTSASVDGTKFYSSGCFNGRICQATMQRMFSLYGLQAVGRRAEVRLCTACCGDTLCNNKDCAQLMNSMYQLYASGHLNVTTLQAI